MLFVLTRTCSSRSSLVHSDCHNRQHTPIIANQVLERITLTISSLFQLQWPQYTLTLVVDIMIHFCNFDRMMLLPLKSRQVIYHMSTHIALQG